MGSESVVRQVRARAPPPRAGENPFGGVVYGLLKAGRAGLNSLAPHVRAGVVMPPQRPNVAGMTAPRPWYARGTTNAAAANTLSSGL